MNQRPTTNIRDTFTLLEGQTDVVAGLYYQRLFATTPSLRMLFDPEIEILGQAWMAAIKRTVDSLDKLDEVELLILMLARMGCWNDALELRAWHYEKMGEALLWTLRQRLGPAFTPPLREAWREAYALGVRAMSGGGRAGEVR